jgi:hypothetical protein
MRGLSAAAIVEVPTARPGAQHGSGRHLEQPAVPGASYFAGLFGGKEGCLLPDLVAIYLE